MDFDNPAIFNLTKMAPKAPCAGVWAPGELSYFTATVSGILSIMTTGGNILVILAVIKDPFKKLRTPFMFFLVSLAISDLLVGAVTMPTSVITHTLEAHRTKKVVHVRIIQLSYFISANASILNLAALCLDRYFAVAHPMKYRRRMTLRKCSLVSVFIWLLAFSLPMLFFVTGYITYLMIFAHTGVILTLGILIFTYFKVYKTLKLQTQKFASSQGSSIMKSDTEGERKNEEDRKELSLKRGERKVTRAFLTILVLFSICYIPVIIMIYMLQFCPKCNCNFRHVLRDLQFLFAISNSTVNPFVCTIRLKPFRQALIALLKIEKGHKMQHYDGSNTSETSAPRKITLSSTDHYNVNLTQLGQ